MKNKKHFGYIFITGLLFSSLAILPDPGQNELKRSIVQVRVTNQAPNYLYPWQAKTPRSHGAVGIVVNGNRILVLTSQISNFSLIEVKKFSSFNAYRASLIKSDFESNLTLLEIEDKDFFSDTVPVRFEKKISIRDNVTFYQLDNAGTLQSAKGRITGLDMDASTLGHTELPYLDINSNEKLDGNGELILEKGNPAGIVTEFTANKNSGKGLPGFVINSFLKSANSTKTDRV
ncbi:MAG: hypothetical protein K8R21_06875 [Leptospira sp.]|nr:hypothetical protein [Leptospira sp.]